MRHPRYERQYYEHEPDRSKDDFRWESEKYSELVSARFCQTKPKPITYIQTKSGFIPVEIEEIADLFGKTQSIAFRVNQFVPILPLNSDMKMIRQATVGENLAYELGINVDQPLWVPVSK